MHSWFRKLDLNLLDCPVIIDRDLKILQTYRLVINRQNEPNPWNIARVGDSNLWYRDVSLVRGYFRQLQLSNGSRLTDAERKELTQLYADIERIRNSDSHVKLFLKDLP